ncbi:hypothetical protein B7Z17_04555 [Candidatus Saccharibacteria bacterium 32-49-10]|nr:MAG: hypothetical protein B7Z17_04555 [Candidatus Saccharibacteria bacterium 32-49-10]
MTKRMLDNHFTDCFSSVEHTNFYASASDQIFKRSKGEVCRKIGANILIDDYVLHGESVISEAALKNVVVFGDYPWNKNDILLPGMVRCFDWQSTIREVERIASGE